MRKLVFVILCLAWGAGFASMCWAVIWALSQFSIWQAMILGAAGMGLFLIYSNDLQK